MGQPGYQDGSEQIWWWKVAQHLDEAQLALVNAMAHNLADPTPVLALQDKIRESQSILLYIFHAKGLLPASVNGAAEAPETKTAATAVAVPIPTVDAATAPLPIVDAVPLPPPGAWVPGAWISAAQETPPIIEQVTVPPVQDLTPAVTDEVMSPVATEEVAPGVVVTLGPASAASPADPNPEA